MFVNLLIYQVYEQSISEAQQGKIIKILNKPVIDMVLYRSLIKMPDLTLLTFIEFHLC